ncbi:MAG: PQQ-binding-like beta-propeller repeat protein, partial [Hyphomonadaceae bacterium]|nr:PQQ-binding-like beta-propeller repeat protein [Hyphomonadaceae bacterium]
SAIAVIRQQIKIHRERRCGTRWSWMRSAIFAPFLAQANPIPRRRIKNTNAIIAVDLKTGKEKWSFHATPKDIFNSGCGPAPKPGAAELHAVARKRSIATWISEPR